MKRRERVLAVNYSCRVTNYSRSRWNVFRHDRIGSNPRVIANGNAPYNLGTRADVDMTTDPGQSRRCVSERYLLKDQTVGADLHFRMDHNSIGMRNEQAAIDPAIQGDIRPGNN